MSSGGDLKHIQYIFLKFYHEINDSIGEFIQVGGTWVDSYSDLFWKCKIDEEGRKSLVVLAKARVSLLEV